MNGSRTGLQSAFALLLGLSGLITGYLGLRLLVDTPGMMMAFGIEASAREGLDLLIAVLGGCIVSLAAFTLLAGHWVWRSTPGGRTLGLFGGASLLLVAVCAYVMAGSLQVLLLDGIRGSVLLAVGLAWRPAES